MKKLAFVLCVLISVQFYSCSRKVSHSSGIETYDYMDATSQTINNGYTTTSDYYKTGASNSVEHAQSILQLDDHLRGLAGVNVTGSGSRAIVTVRGINSFQSASNEPLFIVNSSPMTNYSSAYMAVNPIDIKRVTVLSDAASTGIYGVRGANGVIIITVKNTN